MKIALVGLAGCGKTSLYLIGFTEATPEQTKSLSPKIKFLKSFY